IINADIKLIVRRAQESARQLAQFARRSAGQSRELPATPLINQAILEVDPDLRVSPLEKALDLTEECFVHALAVVPLVAFVRVILKNVETMIVVEIDQF